MTMCPVGWSHLWSMNNLIGQRSCYRHCCRIWLLWVTLLCSLSVSNWNDHCNPTIPVLTLSREVCSFALPILFIGWQCSKIDYIWVSKQRLSSKHWPPDGPTVQALDPGLNIVYSGVYKGFGDTSPHVFRIDTIGPLCWSFLGSVGLSLL